MVHLTTQAMDVLPIIFLFFLAKCHNVNPVIVRVNEGLIDGLLLNLSTGLGTYYSFKGVPYAEPPVGTLRFKDPKPHQPWTGIQLAHVHKPICIQFNDVVNLYLPGSEDCLYLNVYTPDLKPEKLLPVMFFIHGGAFRSGSGNALIYGPDFIVQKNVVLVTINYRLDALGFLNLGTKDVPGNAGLKDQALALKWVHDNIQHFGGDPNEVTIMGQSAGSASVIYHLLSPMSKGLFKRAIAMSGVPFCEWALPYKLTKRSFELGRLLGRDTDDPDEMLEFLQSLPALRIVHNFPTVIPEENDWNKIYLKMTEFQPAPEKDSGQERFLVESPIETLKRGNVTPVELLIGYTSMESIFQLDSILTSDTLQKYNAKRELLIPREILLYGTAPINTEAVSKRIHDKYFGDKAIDLQTIDRFVQYMSDEIFVYNINRFIRHLPGLKAYLYKFFCVSERNRFTPLGLLFGINGVAHTDDFVYLFDSRVQFNPGPVDLMSREYRLINQTVTLFTNFAKYGNPTPDDSLGAVWPEYNVETKSYMAINDTLTTGRDVDSDVNAFWQDIYEEGGVELA